MPCFDLKDLKKKVRAQDEVRWRFREISLGSRYRAGGFAGIPMRIVGRKYGQKSDRKVVSWTRAVASASVVIVSEQVTNSWRLIKEVEVVLHVHVRRKLRP